MSWISSPLSRALLLTYSRSSGLPVDTNMDSGSQSSAIREMKAFSSAFPTRSSLS
ncbi:MAG: hypothetical protein ACP5LG_01085 [Conexivisphaera sp.]